MTHHSRAGKADVSATVELLSQIRNFTGSCQQKSNRDRAAPPAVGGTEWRPPPSRCCVGGHHSSYHLGKIRHVVVPWASKRPPLSVIRPSAVPTRRPELKTIPSAVIRPVSGAIGRKSEILNSRVVWPMPFSSVDKTASPMQLSSSVADRPPCTPPAGLRWVSFGSAVMTTRPLSASVMSYPKVLAIVFSGRDPSTSPWTNSRPLISFCLSALTVPYVLLTLGIGLLLTRS